MGYTHYWHKSPLLDRETFMRACADFNTCIPSLESMGITLKGTDGTGKPVIGGILPTPTGTRQSLAIGFNGDAQCNHHKRPLHITWPVKGAHGVALVVTQETVDRAYEKLAQTETLPTLAHNPEELPLQDSDVSGSWLAGALVNQRTCGGDCSHESFIMYQHQSTTELEEGKQLLFDFTKTAFKPYDLAVQVCLIIFAHHFPNDVLVSSDGGDDEWLEAKLITEQLLNYGAEFEFGDHPQRELGRVLVARERRSKTTQLDTVGDFSGTRHFIGGRI